MWSAKESAYKAWLRQTNSSPVFNPIKFECKNIDSEIIQILKDKLVYNIQVLTTGNYIYTANVSDQNTTSKIFKTRLDYLQYLEDLESSGWTLEKSEFNIPYFSHRNTKETKLVSLSHDQQWTAIQYEGELISLKSSQSKE